MGFHRIKQEVARSLCDRATSFVLRTRGVKVKPFPKAGLGELGGMSLWTEKRKRDSDLTGNGTKHSNEFVQ